MLLAPKLWLVPSTLLKHKWSDLEERETCKLKVNSGTIKQVEVSLAAGCVDTTREKEREREREKEREKERERERERERGRERERLTENS